MAARTSGELVTVDGTRGEGGGQILRSSLALSMVTGRPIHVTDIRAGRRKPGLLRQHLTAVQAAARICDAEVDGDELGSGEIRFRPHEVRAGHFDFAVGSAGSTTLVLQTILPALMLASGRSTLVIEGGTHNPWAPPYEFLKRSFARCIEQMGPRLFFELERPGFHPAGGGRLRATIEPVTKLAAISLMERGTEISRSGDAIVAHVPESVARRELLVLQKKLAIRESDLTITSANHSKGPGNAVSITLEFDEVTEVFNAIGEKSVKAERVAKSAVGAAERYLETSAPVGPYLADQLLLPMALAGAGEFRASHLTKHALTNIDVIRLFVDTPITLAPDDSEDGPVVRFG